MLNAPLRVRRTFAVSRRGARLRHRGERLELLSFLMLILAFFSGCAAVALGSVAAARAVSTSVSLPNSMDLQAWRHR